MSGRAVRRLLAAAGITAAGLIVGAHNSGGTTPTALSGDTPSVGLSVPIFTPPPTTPAVRGRTATALASGTGQRAFLDVINNDGGPDFVSVPDANLVELVGATCADLALGNSVAQSLEDTESDVMAYPPDRTLTDDDVGFLVGAAVAGQCSRFTSVVAHWTLADNTDAGVEP
jgi:hypothetical protein